MQERKQNTRKRKMHIIRMAVVVIPLILLLLSQTAFAQNTYVITDGDRVLVHTSSATDPAVVLTEAGLALGADDTYTTQTGIGRSEITVQRVQNVTIDYCGEILEVSSTSETVGQLLQRLDLTVGSDMNVSVPMEAEAEDGMIITVSRTVLGAIKLTEHPELHEKQIVYFLSDAFKGCGYTKEAVKALSDEALKCKDIPYVIIVADEGNASQQRVAEKTGFGLYEKRVSVAEHLTGVTTEVYLYFRKY